MRSTLLLFVLLLFCSKGAFAQEEFDSSCSKLSGQLTVELSKETRFQADGWWQGILLAAWVYAEPISGSLVSLFVGYKQVESRYISADYQEQIGRVSMGEYSPSFCSDISYQYESNKLSEKVDVAPDRLRASR